MQDQAKIVRSAQRNDERKVAQTKGAMTRVAHAAPNAEHAVRLMARQSGGAPHIE